MSTHQKRAETLTFGYVNRNYDATIAPELIKMIQMFYDATYFYWIDKICGALSRYYQSLGKQYDKIFSNWCDDNGMDDETVSEELTVQPADCLLVDFDDNFPFQKPPTDKAQAIFDIIRKCKDNPNISFALPFPTCTLYFFLYHQ